MFFQELACVLACMWMQCTHFTYQWVYLDTWEESDEQVQVKDKTKRGERKRWLIHGNFRHLPRRASRASQVCGEKKRENKRMRVSAWAVFRSFITLAVLSKRCITPEKWRKCPHVITVVQLIAVCNWVKKDRLTKSKSNRIDCKVS